MASLWTLWCAASWAVIPVTGEQGPPTVHLDRDPGTQVRMSDDVRLRGLEDRFGGGPWAWRFDERDGRVRSVMLPGLALSRAELLAHALAGSAELEPVREVHEAERHTYVWRQVHDGVPLWGTEVVLFAENDRLHAARLRLSRPPIGDTDADLYVPHGKRWVPAFEERDGDEVRWFDTAGGLLRRWDERRYVELELEYETRNHLQGSTEGPARRVLVSDGDGSESTGDDGTHSRSDPYEVSFTGDEVVLYDEERGADIVSAADLYGDTVLEGDAQLTWPAADVFSHFWVVRDWLEERCPDCDLLDEQVEATVNISSRSCNAFYTSGTINFYVGNAGCANLGRFADVIYHEYGHGIHHYILEAGTFAGDVSEGSADYVAATILDDATLAPDYAGTGTWIRELETDRVYPDDVTGGVHNDGLIWGSFMWNLRAQWQADYGEEDGTELADLLFLDTLAQGPSLTDLGDAVIIADDDDGDLTNGTPHACELWDLLDQHGLGPGSIGVVTLEHEALQAQSSATTAYPVEFTLTDVTNECSGLDPDSVRVFYTLDDVPSIADEAVPEGLTESVSPDTGLDSGAGDSAGGHTGDTGRWLPGGDVTWYEVPLTRSDSAYVGEIPRQPANGHVRYFLSAVSTDGEDTFTSHGGDTNALYDFWVGDREALWCDDFEAGVDDWLTGAGTPWSSPMEGWTSEWEVGVPAEASDWDAMEATSGTQVFGTNLGDDGYYAPNNVQYARSPLVTLDGPAPMLLLSYQRWLTVEDARYDVASLYVGDSVLWTNPASDSGGEHTLDRDWVLHDIELSEAIGGPGSMRFTFTLSSDSGLEYGGWTLDDVCVVQLAEPETHYRGAELTASDDGSTTITVGWTNPWVQPLETLVVVRKAGALPEHHKDGVAVAYLDDPTPGESLEVQDTEVVPGVQYGYAVFAAGADETWYGEAELGVDADYGSVPAVDTAPPDDTAVELADKTVVTVTQPVLRTVGCGCAGGGGPAGALATLLALTLGLRRRRR